MAAAAAAFAKAAEELAKAAVGDFAIASTAAYAAEQAEVNMAIRDSLQNIHELCKKGVAVAENISRQSGAHAQKASELKAATAELLRGLSASVKRQTRISSLQWAYDHASQMPITAFHTTGNANNYEVRQEEKTSLFKGIITTVMSASSGYYLPELCSESPHLWMYVLDEETRKQKAVMAQERFRDSVKDVLFEFTGLSFDVQLTETGKYAIFVTE